MNTHKIILGDCIAGMQTLPAECIQTCITSPPYFGLRDYQGGTEEIGQEETVEGYVEKMVEVFREIKRILRDDGTVWLNLGDSYMSAKGCSPPPQTFANGNADGQPKDFVPPNRRDQKGLKNKDMIGIPWRVAFALQADGWYLRQDIIWNKPNPMPESVTDRCTKSHEYIFMLSKNQKYFYDNTAIKEKTSVDRTKELGRAVRKRNHGGRTDGYTVASGTVGDGISRNKRTVWTVTTKPFRGAHFATFPKDLIEPCVLAGCPVGGTVFDPFTGSGTTAIVAMNHGRNFIGTELNPEYIKIAESRITKEVPNTLQEFIQ